MSHWFVGAYSADMDGEATGIATLASRPDGSLENLGLAASAESPAFLATDGETLYAAAEGRDSVLAFDRDGLSLTLRGEAPAGGASPCHLGLYDSRVVTSCYADGVVGVLAADPFALVQALEGEGAGPHEAQDGPHAHSTFRLEDDIVLSADLGADRIHVHRFRDGRLHRESSLELPAGTGPRDIRRHSSGRLLVLGELSLEVLVIEWDGTELGIVSATALPGAKAGDHAAEVSLSTDERFAYVGLRGSNLISVLSVEPDASLAPLGSVSCGGDWPRHHVVDGDVLHVANQRSSTVASFRIGSDGMPELIAEPTAVASPTLLLKA